MSPLSVRACTLYWDFPGSARPTFSRSNVELKLTAFWWNLLFQPQGGASADRSFTCWGGEGLPSAKEKLPSSPKTRLCTSEPML